MDYPISLMIMVVLAEGFDRVEEHCSLTPVVQQIGEAVLATTDTMDSLAQRVDMLAQQVQQQGYQLFALSDVVQTLAETQGESLKRLDKLTDVLERLVMAIEQQDEAP
jgi:ABC-type transporter Mla subunit MlaD